MCGGTCAFRRNGTIGWSTAIFRFLIEDSGSRDYFVGREDYGETITSDKTVRNDEDLRFGLPRLLASCSWSRSRSQYLAALSREEYS